jgi:electron transfer flavoprotein alpha subunit
VSGAKDEYSGVWIVAEQREGRVTQIGHELLTRAVTLAKKLRTGCSAMVFGNSIPDEDLRGLIDRGADRVVAMEHPGLEHFLLEPYASCMVEIIEKYKPAVIIAGATTTGRTLLPYVAVKVHAGLTADCTELDIEEDTGNLLQTRPAIGGNILATIKTPEHRPQMATVRPRSTRPAEPMEGREGDIIRLAPSTEPVGRIQRVDFIKNEDEQNLQETEVVVAAGRGMKKGENLSMVYDLADALGGAVGGSRDVVDRGWLSYPHQVGLSGTTVTPKLYVAAGISGAIQHLAGMQTSENIVAINTDPEAQIFRVAEIGVVGDAIEFIPLLTERIRRAK